MLSSQLAQRFHSYVNHHRGVFPIRYNASDQLYFFLDDAHDYEIKIPHPQTDPENVVPIDDRLHPDKCHVYRSPPSDDITLLSI